MKQGWGGSVGLGWGGVTDLGLWRWAGLTQIVHPQVVPRQPDQSAGRAHADACPPGRGLPGAETERAQLLRHFLPVRGSPGGLEAMRGTPGPGPLTPCGLSVSVKG